MSVDSGSDSLGSATENAATARCVDELDRQAVRELFRRIGDKWSLVVVAELRGDPKRFTTLLARIDGISHRLLTTTLRGLERDGLVRRTAYAEVPPRVEYALTALGELFLEPLLALVTWSEIHRVEVDEHRREYDARRARLAGHDGRDHIEEILENAERRRGGRV